MLPVYIEAQYADGHVHREDERDQSAYEEHRNVFWDILHRLPEAEHGKMVRFSLVNVNANERTDVDFSALPDNARPIRFKHMEADFVGSEMVETRLMGIDFGYQYTDENGENVQEVVSI